MGKRDKLLKLVILVLMSLPAAFGQTNNFEFVQHDTVYTGAEDFVVLHGEITSLSAATQSLTVTRVTHQKDSLWTTSFCVGPACLPPFLDTFTFDLAALDTAEFTLDTYPNGVEGVGVWTIFAVDSTTMEVDSVNIRMEYVTVGVDPAFPAPNSFSLSSMYPNPTNAAVSFDLNLENSGNYTIILFALDGREVMSRSYQLYSGKHHLQWGLQGLPSGNYIMSASGAGQTISQKVVVIK